jgi:hypothetical protein
MSRSRQQPAKVAEEGSLHKYRTEIPNTIIKGKKGRGLSLPARWLYVYLKSVTGETGECWQNSRTLAQGAQIGLGTIPGAKKELVTAGLIAIIQRKDGYHDSDKIRLLDIWAENMEEFKSPRCSGDEQPSLVVQEMNNRCSGDEQQITEVKSDTSIPSCSGDEQLVVQEMNERRSHKPEEEERDNSVPTVQCPDIPKNGNAKLTPEALINLFNAQCPAPTPKVLKITDARRKKANIYLRQFPQREFWVGVFNELAQSNFLMGGNNNGWVANFDWLLSKGKNDQVENCMKVAEGRYRDKLCVMRRTVTDDDILRED